MRVLAISLLFLVFTHSYSQEFTLDKDFEISIQGTSTLHDWEMSCNEATGSADFSIKNNKIKGVRSLTLEIKSTSLKSGKESMDENAYKALKTDSYNAILFSLQKTTSVKALERNIFRINFEGTLTVAGESRPVSSSVKCTASTDRVQCEGSFNLQMTDFKIDPPTALFGSIETDNNISVFYNTTYVR